MSSDDDMDIDTAIPSASKGKAKAVDICASSDADTLPWYVLRLVRVFGSRLYALSFQGRKIPTSHAQRRRFP